MFSRSEIVQITTTTTGGNFPIRSSCEMVLATFKYLEDAKKALKGLVAKALPGTRMAVRYFYTETDSYLVDDTTIPNAVELDPYDGVPADTGTV